MSLKDMSSKDWEMLYGNWQKSGLSQRKFCESQGIEYKAFAYRREKASLAKRRADCAPPKESSASTPLPRFIPIEVSPVKPVKKSPLFSWIEIQLPHGICLRIPTHEVA